MSDSENEEVGKQAETGELIDLRRTLDWIEKTKEKSETTKNYQ